MFKYRSVVDSSVIFSLEPFHSVFLGDSVLGSDDAFASSSEGHSVSRALEHDVEVHAVDTGVGVILNTQIDMLLNTESEVSSL